MLVEVGCEFFHYTYGHKLEGIFNAQALLPHNYSPKISVQTGQIFLNPNENKELPLLWFSTNSQWEPTSSKNIVNNGRLTRLSFEQGARMLGCVRFKLLEPQGLLSFEQACKFAKIPLRERKRMTDRGIAWGSYPKQWFALSRAVPLSALQAQRYDLHSKQWIDLDWNQRDLCAPQLQIVDALVDRPKGLTVLPAD